MASYSTRENNSWQIFDKARNLKSTLVNQSKNVGNIIKTTVNAAENKWKASSTLTKACIIGSATALVAPLAILPALSVVGFTSAGVAAGSLAASMQTATTVSGSVFALCQSAAATGAVAVSTSVGVSLGAGATAGGVTAVVCRKKSRNQNNGDEAQVEIEEEEDF
jgi:mannose/fructose/N-acetylgalactosamine-specific phosphotransferase system component IID